MTEIFGTLGPACSDVKTLEEMFRHGMHGMRLNMSHTSLTESADMIDNYHTAAKNAGVEGGLLIDLQGGELRLGKVRPGTVAENGSLLHFSADGTESSIPIPPSVYAALELGDELLIDDGKILLKVTNISGDGVETEVLRGGSIESQKSIKIVGKEVHSDILTRQDRENILLSRRYGVTAIMQPFVTKAAELLRIREFLSENGLEALRLFAKIESLDGVDNLDEILPLADMIVIARGDLGNDMPLWELPGVQKKIAQKCICAHKPFLVVTQLLSSMISSPTPTRAEVSDIFNAVLDGATALMVTNETAVGSYPAEVIDYLSKTAGRAESFKADYTSSAV